MLELVLTLLLLGLVVWQAHRRECRAYDRGIRAGYAIAEQNAAQRQERTQKANER